MTLRQKIEDHIGITAFLFGSAIVATTLSVESYFESRTAGQEVEHQKTPLPLVLQAREAITEGGACFDCLDYGPVLSNNSNASQYNAASWKFEISPAGTYAISMRYASPDPRPGRIIVNGGPALEGRFGESTNSVDNAMNFPQGCHEFVSGINSVRIEQLSAFPHIESLTISEAVPGSC